MDKLKIALKKIADRQTLNCDEAEQALSAIISGQATPAQLGAFIMGLRVRGETADELLGAARCLRKIMLPISAPDNAIDIVGTGGDYSGSYNISTAVALVVAACGVPVAKHGNRSVSSRSGAADVLQALGVNLNCSFSLLEEALQKVNLCFLMAPRHHPALKTVAPVRAELGTRSLFNLLGPLLNPASVQKHIIGVFEPNWLVPFAEALREMGSRNAWIVCGEDGLDELTTTGKTYVAELKDDFITTFEVTPEQAGLFYSNPSELKGGDALTNATALKALLAGSQNAYRNIVLFNAAAALMVVGKVESLREGAEMARHAIDSGKAKQTLDMLIQITNQI